MHSYSHFYLSITKTKKGVNRYYTEIVLWLRGHGHYFLGEEKWRLGICLHSRANHFLAIQPLSFSLLIQCDRCSQMTVWRLMAGLEWLPTSMVVIGNVWILSTITSLSRLCSMEVSHFFLLLSINSALSVTNAFCNLKMLSFNKTISINICNLVSTTPFDNNFVQESSQL